MIPTTSTKLFVYGTLMTPQVLEILLGRVPDCCKASLENYKRHPVVDHVFPGMIQATSEKVNGLLLLDVTPSELDVLDWFEGDEYERLEVELSNPKNEALTYLWSNPVSQLDLTRTWDQEEFVSKHLEWYLSHTVKPCRLELDRLGIGVVKKK